MSGALLPNHSCRFLLVLTILAAAATRATAEEPSAPAKSATSPEKTIAPTARPSLKPA